MADEKPYIVDGERVSLEEYRKTKYEDLRIRVPKGRKALIQSAADAADQSLNGYVVGAVEARMERESAANEEAASE